MADIIEINCDENYIIIILNFRKPVILPNLTFELEEIKAD